MSGNQKGKPGPNARKELTRGIPRQVRDPPQCPNCLANKQRATGMDGTVETIHVQFKRLRSPIEPEGTYVYVRLEDRRMNIRKILEQFDSRNQLLKDLCMFTYERAMASDPERWQVASKMEGILAPGSPLVTTTQVIGAKGWEPIRCMTARGHAFTKREEDRTALTIRVSYAGVPESPPDNAYEELKERVGRMEGKESPFRALLEAISEPKDETQQPEGPKVYAP